MILLLFYFMPEVTIKIAASKSQEVIVPENQGYYGISSITAT